MAQQIADRRDIDFVLHEQMKVADLAKNDKFADFTKKTVDMIVSEARNLAIKEILPTFKESDEGCVFDNGAVKVPESFHRVFKLYREGEWLAMIDEPEWGGQGMPKTVSLAADEYFYGANSAFMLYHGLTHGAANLVSILGDDTQKRLYLKKLLSGEWSGTMLLTEPEAGSDVGALTTKAVKNPDGTYSITGTKIFISGGEHDMVDNIIHPVLARIEGAPAGTKGISLFLVPKNRVNDDGTLGECNDVVCTGIEEKMGLHGNCTCTLTLGSRDNCIGTLIGPENKGMRAMFLMMNEARQLVGLQGFAVASAAYINALNYARERVQGNDIMAGKNPDAGPVPIVRHPDVRRQLLTMKAYVEGMRSLIYYGGLMHDMEGLAQTEEEKAKYADRTAILTPIIKGYITDKALEVTSHGVQIFGGYGFTKEYPAEQLMRDCRIFMIYEGTNGIQAMDLLGRKLGMKKGKPFIEYLEEMRKTVINARGVAGLENMSARVETAINSLGQAAAHLGKTAASGKVREAYAYAHPLLEVTGDVTMAWMLLWRACLAAKKLHKSAGGSEPEKMIARAQKNKDAAYYYGEIKTAEFFISNMLAATMGKFAAIIDTNPAAVEFPEAGFGA
ncbi:MAG: acyl-CoA dehydrogenase [Deltaproteobacteria bacterium]|nr:acyl-CoA dehydrogenase [Deltaproteobacteria bacterium]